MSRRTEFVSRTAHGRSAVRWQMLATALRIDANRPERAYNWAFQASSRLVWFMTAPRARAKH